MKQSKRVSGLIEIFKYLCNLEIAVLLADQGVPGFKEQRHKFESELKYRSNYFVQKYGEIPTEEKTPELCHWFNAFILNNEEQLIVETRAFWKSKGGRQKSKDTREIREALERIAANPKARGKKIYAMAMWLKDRVARYRHKPISTAMRAAKFYRKNKKDSKPSLGFVS